MIIEYLSRNGERAVSADEIVTGLAREYGGDAPGKSTVYRLLPRLCEEGGVKRFKSDSSRKTLYQSVDKGHCHEHLHMKCLSCGKLLHMTGAVTKLLFDEVHENTDFHIDRRNTVLYGLCGECGHRGAV